MYHRLYRSRNRNLIRNIFTYLGSENKQLLFSQTKLQDWGFFVNWSIISCREEARFLSTIHARFPLRSVKPCNCWERCSQPLKQISHIVWTLRSVWMDRHIVFCTATIWWISANPSGKWWMLNMVFQNVYNTQWFWGQCSAELNV
jgi:hypothetical protein